MRIAIVEDDINMRKSLEIALGEYKEFSIVSYKSALDALKKLDENIDLIVTDINMPGMDGIEFVKKLDGAYDIIIITGNATLNRAIESVRLGVKDFITKPFEIDTLVDAIKRHVKISAKVKQKSDKSVNVKDEPRDFVATSPALEKALHVAKKAARTTASILLLGESGVGKELFANYIHKNSPRANKPFVALNMAAIPENLLESELFGYEKGAFTDATSEKKGHFEVANGGTLFLDEIGEMPVALQAKLLRVVQERVMVRVGGTKEIPIDVRIVSATNADIKKFISEGNFREDLYYRLNTVPVKIPPLRERKEEIVPISEYTLASIIKKYELDSRHFSQEATESLLSYGWPGNIRELISVVERAAILSDSEEITSCDLFLESREGGKDIKTMEKELIIEVLQSVKNDLDEACSILGMSKKALVEKINKYHIEV
ncbi:MAG: sigma-54 dependent transcriptional regulator [Sulfurospirillaceae bacterium]|nr:sigma-54 dependent transcriptional regulator [Sulfurospirillaceae bacterium]